MRRYILKTNPSAISDRDWTAHNYTERKAFDILTGLALGILSDGELTQREAIFLGRWIECNSRILPETFIRKLLPIVRLAGAGEELSEASLDEIALILESIAYGNASFDPSIPAPVIGTPCELIYDEMEPAEIRFVGLEFIFTGNFLTGKKIDLMSRTIGLGALAKSAKPTKNTDFVIVGSHGSDRWAYSGLGRKVEHALVLRDSGCKLRVIREEVFIQALERIIPFPT